jgi:hypothetical protein
VAAGSERLGFAGVCDGDLASVWVSASVCGSASLIDSGAGWASLFGSDAGSVTLSGSGSGCCSASGCCLSAGSSKAGRAWCQGASELREFREADAPSVVASVDVWAACWLAEPSPALRVRRAVVGVPDLVGGVPDVVGGVPVAAGDPPVSGEFSESVATGSPADVWAGEAASC